MKTAIVYVSKHGTTEKVAKLIKEKLENHGQVELISLKDGKNPNLMDFDKVILGTSIYAGMPSKKMIEFCKAYQDTLLQKKLGLFICCMQPDKEVRLEQLKNAYPEVLRNHAGTMGIMGGEFLFDKLNFFERLVVKKASKVSSTTSDIDHNAITKFSDNYSKLY
jgi:menaquinone-dependent protoporphyrinogen oxidase